MFKEYDIVESTRSLNKKVLDGCKGTIVFVYPNNDSIYEVEFVNNANETLDVLTVKASDIKIY